MNANQQNALLMADETTTDSSTSQLFTVRIWPSHSSHSNVPWRGKVHHIPTGAWRYFRDWEGLFSFFETQLATNENTPE